MCLRMYDTIVGTAQRKKPKGQNALKNNTRRETRILNAFVLIL